MLITDQHRGSDIVNSTSKESSNVPSSLNGYVYNPNYSTSGNGSVKTPLLSGGAAKLSQGGHTYMGNNYEMVDDLAVDLSEYVDCSVVDSGYVSEYCKHNMQVNISLLISVMLYINFVGRSVREISVCCFFVCGGRSFKP